MSALVRRLKRGFRRHGMVGSLSLGVEHIMGYISRLRPSIRAEFRNREDRARTFDREHGVNTAGRIHQADLNINSPNQLHAVRYEGSDPKAFRDAIGILPIDLTRFVFIDIGSGKGRAILMAAEFPFERIIGLEFSEELHGIAQNNIKHFRGEDAKCINIESVCVDAVDYLLPDDCLVCYFCNPFDETVMNQVLMNIRKSLIQNPREVYIVYYNPREGHLLDQSDCFIAVETRGNVRIWKAKLESLGKPREDSLC